MAGFRATLHYQSAESRDRLRRHAVQGRGSRDRLAARNRARAAPASVRSASAAPTRTWCSKKRRVAQAIGSPARPVTLLPLSARDEQRLKRRAADLGGGACRTRSDAELVRHRLHARAGRKPMSARGAIVARSVAEARERLASCRRLRTAGHAPRLVFLFPGQGSQHPDMARELVDRNPCSVTRSTRCCAWRRRASGLRPARADPARRRRRAGADAALTETRHAQPALFAVEYALAELGNPGATGRRDDRPQHRRIRRRLPRRRVLAGRRASRSSSRAARRCSRSRPARCWRSTPAKPISHSVCRTGSRSRRSTRPD